MPAFTPADGTSGCGLHVWLEPGTAPASVVDPLTVVVAEAEHAAAPYTIGVRLCFSHRPHRMPHVR